MSEEFASTLQLSKNTCNLPVGAHNELSTIVTRWVTADIYSINNKFHKALDFLIIPTIATIPDQLIKRQNIHLPSNLKLADPEFHKPAPVHILLGAGASLSLLCVGQINLSRKSNQKTLAGWTIGGTITYPENDGFTRCNLTNLKDNMDRFWEIEETAAIKHLAKDEALCEEHYERHVTRKPNGKYEVALPFNNRKMELGSSPEIALKRLTSLEKRLQRDEVLRQQYTDIINEYKQLGHMIKVEGEPKDGFFLPHHAVFKLTSLTQRCE